MPIILLEVRKKTIQKLLFQLNTGGDVLERVSESKKINRVKLSCSSNNKLFQNGQRVWRGPEWV